MTQQVSPNTESVIYILLRRMRRPLILLILVYSASILGLTLIPGMNDQGQPWRMDFFHAFYFVSFMGTTIGFGEIPYPFTDSQRMWTTVSLYATVITWLYVIGMLLTVLQDSAFQKVLNLSSFTRAVRRIRDPFYIICGYGDTGSLVVKALATRGIRSSVIDINQTRIDHLDTSGLEIEVPGLCADAADPDTLLAAGLKHPSCIGVVAITNDDKANLTIAISCKLLTPDLKMICRAESHDVARNMASFGTDHIINPFDTFASLFSTAIFKPSLYLLYQWLASHEETTLTEPVVPPKGHWIICGYGRFGKALKKYMESEDVQLTIIEADPENTHAPKEAIIGRGTEADTLQAAKIDQASGIIAGTDNDANNLSIIMTAHDLRPEMFKVGRQNESRNDAIFSSAPIDLLMQRADILADKVSTYLLTPLLDEFVKIMGAYDNDWANELLSRITGVAQERPPETWSLEINETEAEAVYLQLKERKHVVLGDLLRDPRNRDEKLSCLALLKKHNEQKVALPDDDTELEIGDQLLFCGHIGAIHLMHWTCMNQKMLMYTRTGKEEISGSFWRALAGKD